MLEQLYTYQPTKQAFRSHTLLNSPLDLEKSHFGFVNQAHSACQHAGMHREFCTATVIVRSSSMQTRTPS